MSALFVTPMLPWNLSEDRHGVFQRMRLLLDAARRAFGTVTVVLVVQAGPRPDPSFLADLERVRSWLETDLGEGYRVELLPFEARAPSWIERLPRADWYLGPSPLPRANAESIAQLDALIGRCAPAAIVAHRLLSFSLLRSGVAARTIPCVLDLDDVEHVAFARQLLTPPVWRSKRLRLVHCLPLLAEEIRAILRCRQVYVCSDRDFRRLAPFDVGRRVRVLPNTIPDPHPDADIENQPSDPVVLYVGTLTYAPNLAGLRWFIDSIWPAVVARVPNARLMLVGQRSREVELPGTIETSVDALGFVEDLKPLYARAAAVVCPLLAGGGTRIKIIEAAAHGRPVISTTIGAEGLDFRGGSSILLADSPADFAGRVVDVLRDPGLGRRIGSAARQTFAEQYERSSATSLLAGLLAQATAERAGVGR